MIKIINIKTSNIYFTGDLHGNFDCINYNIKTKKIKDSLIIFCGDIGFGFESMTYYVTILKSINELCLKNNNYIVFLRGNHDDPKYFDGNVFDFERVVAVSDYTILHVERSIPCNIMCIGGAISIDRLYRQKEYKMNIEYLSKYISLEDAIKKTPKLYWDNEINKYDEVALNEVIESGMNVDIVCAHTCPSFCKPTTKSGITYWLALDSNLDADLTAEREVMDNVFNFLKKNGNNLKCWAYGHYHDDNIEKIENIDFIMINMVRNGNMTLVPYNSL